MPKQTLISVVGPDESILFQAALDRPCLRPEDEANIQDLEARLAEVIGRSDLEILGARITMIHKTKGAA